MSNSTLFRSETYEPTLQLRPAWLPERGGWSNWGNRGGKPVRGSAAVILKRVCGHV